MNYTLSNTINKPLAEVVEKFKEPDGVIKWMEGLERIDHISGTPGKKGAKSDFYFVHKGKEMKISETILEENLPEQIKFGYQSSMGYNEVEMMFEETPDGNTKQINNSYFELKGFMKVMGFLMKGMFKKQTMKFLTGFKVYAEKG